MNIPKVGFISLGCPKALVDSERILTRLRRDGYDIAPDYDGADVVIVNTCGFIDSAKEESIESIGEAIQENGRVIVTGCLGVEQEKLKQIHPQILNITGPQQYDQVVAAVHQHAPRQTEHNPYVDLIPPQGIKLTPEHYAYVKISEGCNHKCSFCIIPSMRGKLVSRSLDDVMAEAQELVDAGVQELLIISQDTSAYGSDIKYPLCHWNNKEYKTSLYDMCLAMGELGIWIRLHYVYPYPHVDEIIPLMADGKILPYLDIPFQHGSPKILKAMRRPAATENTLERIHAWRQICPELTLRSTFIVGFPGESDQDFQQLLVFLNEAQLDRVGCFQYSPVEGAVANQLEDHIADELKQERWHQFMQAQSEISKGKMQAKIGKDMEVIIDSFEDSQAIARSHADAPEIDGLVYIQSDKQIPVGKRMMVRITDADEYDLWGEPV